MKSRVWCALLLGLLAALPALANSPPTITGTPDLTATVGTRYTFRPTVSDPDGDTLKFVIANRPKWLTFSYQSGSLAGTPTAANIGVYPNITIYAQDGRNRSVAMRKFAITVEAVKNAPPVISGQPVTSATVGKPYAFQPVASDPENDPLVFRIANKPAWAIFDGATGRLSGTPSAANLGTFADVDIRVTDGTTTVRLPVFSIVVKQIPVASVTLSWTPPTQNTDGSSLQNLAGYRIYYGASASTLGSVIEVKNAAVSAYVVENLVPGTWFFAVTAFNAEGGESVKSNVASKSIS